MKNPKVKKGDKILLKTARNGGTSWIGKVCEVIRGTDNTINGSILAKSVDGTPNTGNITLYYSGPADEFVMADRKSQAVYLKEKLKELASQVKEIKAEIEYLEKYESDEEFVAVKLRKLLKAGSVDAMTEVLKELKRSNIL